jgi:hypothetical protein
MTLRDIGFVSFAADAGSEYRLEELIAAQNLCWSPWAPDAIQENGKDTSTSVGKNHRASVIDMDCGLRRPRSEASAVVEFAAQDPGHYFNRIAVDGNLAERRTKTVTTTPGLRNFAVEYRRHWFGIHNAVFTGIEIKIQPNGIYEIRTKWTNDQVWIWAVDKDQGKVVAGNPAP